MDPGPLKGWFFSSKHGPEEDPITSAKYLRQIYLETDNSFVSRIIVPVLYNRKSCKQEGKNLFYRVLSDTCVKARIVNNESGEIIRIFYTAFDNLLPLSSRESFKGSTEILPSHLVDVIDTFNT
jgi:putative glutathione S-transferase